MTKILFSNIKGKRCAICGRPILTREMYRLDGDIWVHPGHVRFYSNKKNLKVVTNPKSASKKIWVFIILAFTITYATAIILHNPWS